MNRFAFLVLLCLIPVTFLKAQDISFSANGGYLFGDRFKIWGGRAQIVGEWAFMGTAGVEIGGGSSAEITYLFQQTRAKADLYVPQTSLDEPIQMHYILLGASQYRGVGEGFSLGGGGKIGLVVMSPQKQSLEDIVKLAFGLQGGAKYMFNENVGLQFSANLFFPVTDVGGYLWWSPGTGSQVGVDSRIPFLQFGMFGGIILKTSQSKN